MRIGQVVGRVVGSAPIRAATAPPPRSSLVRRREVHDPRLGEHVGDLDPARPPVEPLARGGPGREVPAGGVAQGDRPAPSPSARLMAAWMSSKVSGKPPPLPTRRYSTLRAVQPRADEVDGQGHAEVGAVRRLPEPAVDDDDRPATRARRRRSGRPTGRRRRRSSAGSHWAASRWSVGRLRSASGPFQRSRRQRRPQPAGEVRRPSVRLAASRQPSDSTLPIVRAGA